MKKFDLIHTTILILAVMAAWSAVESFIHLLSNISFAGNQYYPTYEWVLYDLIASLSFSAAAVILVKNARKYTTVLLRDEPDDTQEDALRWKPERDNVLLALLIGIGLYTLIQAIPNIVAEIIHFFRTKVSNHALLAPAPSRNDFIIWILKATIGAFLIYSAPALTAYINKKATTGPDTKS